MIRCGKIDPEKRGARRGSDNFLRESLARYAERMRNHDTPSTRPAPTSEYQPPDPIYREALIRQCWICHVWRRCQHREPELLEMWRTHA
jgi:hypothetical protein